MNASVTPELSAEAPPSLLAVAIATLTDPVALAVLLITVFGFLLPMLWIYPPVAPRISDLLDETHTKLGLGWNKVEDPVGGDEDEDGTGAKAAGRTSAAPAIHSLWVYPIKSCPGIRVARSRVLPTGFEFDRLFTFAQLKAPFPVRAGAAATALSDEQQQQQPPPVVDKDADDDDVEWDFITQRQFPRLASLQVELWQPDLAKVRSAEARMRVDDLAERRATMAESYVVVRYPWTPAGWPGRWAWFAAKLARGRRAVPEVEVVLPLSLPRTTDAANAANAANAAVLPIASDDAHASSSPAPDGPPPVYSRVRVWRDTIRALDLSAELPHSLQLYLGVSNRLGVFRLDPDHLRQIARCAPSVAEAGYQPVTGFQDAYPVHLLNRRSVRALEANVATDAALPDLDERRFRANILVDGVKAYDEDAWKLVSFKPAPASALDAAEFYVCCRTVRCKLPNVNPDTGERHPREPDAALRQYRDVDEGAPKMGCLGMQLTPKFEHTDEPELMELVLEPGMSVNVLERGKHRYIRI